MSKQPALLAPLEHEQYYKDTTWMALPLLCLPVYFYGLRPMLLCAVAILIANICDHVVAKLRGRQYNEQDYSSESFAALFALLMPASISWYILAVGVLACVLIGKEAFGGYGNYVFHPTAVGYAVVAISWPEAVFRYPQPFTTLPMIMTGDVPLNVSMSSTLKNGGLPIISTMELSLGNYAGPIGATAALVLVACALFLFVRRDVFASVGISFLLACAVIAFFFPRQDGLSGAVMETIHERLVVLRFEMLSGAMLFGAVMLICEPFICPKRTITRVIYGALLGVTMMMFRYYGVYETGVCFALLLISTISHPLNRVVEQMFQHRGKTCNKEPQGLGNAQPTNNQPKGGAVHGG